MIDFTFIRFNPMRTTFRVCLANAYSVRGNGGVPAPLKATETERLLHNILASLPLNSYLSRNALPPRSGGSK